MFTKNYSATDVAPTRKDHPRLLLDRARQALYYSEELAVSLPSPYVEVSFNNCKMLHYIQ
jgi:hypothetical protein